MENTSEAALDPTTRWRLPQGAEAPPLGLGTWQLTGERCERIVRAALDLGYRHVDTAEAYGNEEEIGRALAGAGVPRDDLFLTTKVGHGNLRPGEVVRAVHGSLERLGTDHVDLCLVHWPNRSVPMDETIGALRKLRDDGRIRAWGVSNFTPAHLDEALETGRPATNQVELHPYFVQSGLQDACRERDVPITAYSPLARGRVADDPVLGEIGDRHGRTPAQVALRWSLQRGRLVVPKTGSEERLAENFDVFDFRLSGREMERIDGLDRGRRLLNPSWAEFDRDGG